jgi:hypothetical protein
VSTVTVIAAIVSATVGSLSLIVLLRSRRPQIEAQLSANVANESEQIKVLTG